MIKLLKNIVLLGGNVFIEREFTDRWLLDDKDVTFYVLSRSGKNKINYPNIKNIPVDVTNYEKVKEVLPEKIDYIIDFVGRPEKDMEKLIEVNEKPAEVMSKIAKEYNVKAMGFIGGKLGPKSLLR